MRKSEGLISLTINAYHSKKSYIPLEKIGKVRPLDNPYNSLIKK